MIVALDSSILVASLAERERCHAACESLLFEQDCRIYTHALAETFNALTGSRLGYRFPASAVATLLKESVQSHVKVILLNEDDILAAMQQAESRGVRGGAIYDFLHLVAARKAGAVRFYTLNMDDFMGIWRPGDPEILHPWRHRQSSHQPSFDVPANTHHWACLHQIAHHSNIQTHENYFSHLVHHRYHRHLPRSRR